MHLPAGRGVGGERAGTGAGTKRPVAGVEACGLKRAQKTPGGRIVGRRLEAGDGGEVVRIALPVPALDPARQIGPGAVGRRGC